MHWKDLGFAAAHGWWILLAIVALTMIEMVWKHEGLRHPSLSLLKTFTTFLRWLLIAVAFTVILVATRPLRDLESRPFENKIMQPPTNPLPGAETKGQTAADAVKANIDELKWLLTILAGFAVITAIAQAAAAWLSALTYDKQASAKLQEIDKLIGDFKSRYPVFQEVEEKRNQAHDVLIGTLRRVFAVDDPNADATEAISWMENFYKELNVEKRQLLLSVESFASVDLHPPRKGSEVENLKLFAVFYHAKFRYEKGMNAAALFTDLERAEGYLLLALQKAPGDFTLHNELGNIYLTMREYAGELSGDYPNYLEKARASFEQSRSLRKDQQRVYYNLAYIKSAHEKRYDEARDLLMEALACEAWQRVATPDAMAAYIQYNLGCNWARIIARDHNGVSPISLTEAQPVVSALKKAGELGQIKAEYVQIDYTHRTRGDLYGLCQKADRDLRDELNRLKKALMARGTKKPRQGFRETIAEAFEMIWNSAKSTLRKTD
jgi:tetratricopeptide (TPR) repeat protein